MNIHELDSYNLGDAVKFNDELNPRLWGSDEQLRPEVRDQLLKIADDFREFLGIDVEVKDITISGSNAAYTYTPHSDIDLHLVVDLPQADASDVYRELFDAKKYAYNDQHDIKIGGYDVELYVQDANKPHHSQGIYSVADDKWISVPKRRKPDVDDISVKSKFEDLGHRIEAAIESGSYERMTDMAKRLKDYRQAGLDAHGEFGPENLAFKILRTQGLIKKLYDARAEAKDKLLSLDERKKKKKKKQVKYGYGGYWYPGTAYAGQDHPAGSEGGGGDGGGGGESIREALDEEGSTPDGVNPSTTMILSDVNDVPTDEDILRDFVNFVVKELKIKQLPTVKLRKDPQWPVVHKTFGRYIDDKDLLEVAWGQRHIMDVLRTVAHELTHRRQHEREDVPASAGETGSEYENEANARAGILMRDYARLHPEYFAHGQADALTGVEEGWREKAAGVAAAACIAGTPGCATTGQDVGRAVRDIQTIGRTAQSVERMGRAGVQDELSQELRNFIRAQGQGGDAAGANNQSRLYQLQKKIQKPGEVKEGASGYIPTKAQAKDPRFVMALTQDIKPGQVGKEANKLKLKTDKQGHPQIARANGLFENLYKEYKQYKADEDYSPDEPPGPEFKPTMPAGTLRVDVSDVYDWYKLGQHISKMKGLGQHDFGKGPPSTIISFGDEDTEHEFIGDLEKTGLDVTDIDPKDPKKRPGKTVKTDPAYNVDETINAPVSKEQRAEQEYLRFIMAKVNSGRLLNRHEQRFLQDYQLKQKLAEFAPSPGYGDDDWGSDVPRDLHYFANLWWNAADPDTQKYIEDQLDTGGWKIRQIGEEMVELRHREGTRYRINSDEFDPDLYESAELDEVSMKPSRLRQFADSEEAAGILAGFEAELIFRDTQRDDDDGEMEADMDADERTRSIDNIISFFSNDDYGFGLTDRSLERLQNRLDEGYYEWADDQMIDDFNREAIEQIQQWMLDNDEWDWDQATREAIEARGEDADTEAKVFKLMDIKKGSERARFVEENPEYKTAYEIYADAQVDAQNHFDEIADEHYREQDGVYDAALENYRENWEYPDQDNWLTDVGLRWMSDVANEYNLDWPIMTSGSSGGGNRSWEEIADSLQEATGQRVRVGGGYHSTPRGDYYVIEPDGSLDPDDEEDTGLEIVSPPMPLNQAIEQLQSVIEWANTTGNAYTNRSTGLHMGVSIPFKGGNVDFVKLALFLGDEYVLEQFGRAANTYCASALRKLRQNVAGDKNRGDTKIASAMELMKNNLIELAQKYVQQGVGDAKYTSIHIKPGYIEFRSPGGDYLAKADRDIGSLEDTMRRFAYAMYLAGRPDLERQEYYKKLYKLIAPEGNDALNLFAKFATGEIDQAQLKRDWAETQLTKELPSERSTSQWRLYDRSTGRLVTAQEYSNFTQKDAWERARVSVDPDLSMEEFQRRYELRDIGTNTGRWRAIDKGNGNTLAIVDSATRGGAIDQIYDMLGRNAYFYVEPYSGDEKSTEPQKLTRRGELAKRIVGKGSDYVVVNKHSGKVFYTFSASGPSTAASIGMDYLRGRGLDVENFGIQRANSPLVSQDNDRDSGQMQRRLGTNQQRHNYQLYTYDEPDQVFHTMSNATDNEVRAFINQQERDGMPPGFLRVRQVDESANGAEDAQRALDAAARKLGYSNFSMVKPGDRNTVMQMAAHALKSGAGHYNMLDKKKK